MNRYRVYMHSQPAMGRTFYDGKVDVYADNFEEAVEAAIKQAAIIHRHRNWVITSIEIRK